MMLLKHCFFETREITYAGVARRYYGEKLGKVVEICQLFYAISACCGYAIIIANQLDNIVSLIIESHPLPHSVVWMSGIDQLTL